MTDPVPARVRYDEGCLAAHALNLVGDRWALLVVRELMFAAKRFQVLRAGMPGVTASVLTARLGQLRQAGVLEHDAGLGTYALTGAGRGLLPVLEALCQWALAVPGHDPSRFISPSALMISMGACLQPGAMAGRQPVAGFAFGGEAFQARVRGGRLQVQAVDQPRAAFVLHGDGNRLARAVYGRLPLQALARQGVIGVDGDIDAAQAFVRMFALAPPARA